MRSGARIAHMALVLALGFLGGRRAAAAGPSGDASGNDRAAADVLFEQGRAALEKGALAEACPKLEESLRLDRGIGVMLYLAECWQRAGRTASAWEQFREAADLAHTEKDVREKIARDHADQLAPKLSTLTISVASGAAVPEVTRDGRQVGRALWGTDVPIDPGEHVVEARAPGAKPWRTKIVVRPDKDHAVVAVPLLEALPQTNQRTTQGAAEAPAARRVRTWQRVLGASLGALGVGGLAVGAAYGLSAVKKTSRADEHCSSLGCDPVGVDTGRVAKTDANVSTIAFLVGGALIAGGAVLFFTATAPDEPSPNPPKTVGFSF